ncbi:MAG TPA: protein kinase [Terriglobia bacterium]|nr:protein kinase [Terriglobia bacterium]
MPISATSAAADSAGRSLSAVSGQAYLRAGQLLGRYRIEELIGTGGMGAVYRARDLQLDRLVAIKLLNKPITEDSSLGELLLEARTISALNHPNICTVFEVGEEQEHGYICMEYVEGRTLKSLVPAAGLPPSMAAHYGAQIAEALEYAHQRRVLHCDVKSNNIAITADGRVKLLDFGLAEHLQPDEVSRLTSSRNSLADLGPIAGTLPYLAPEILHGKGATPRSDLWSLGVVLHEMCTGRMPFSGQTAFELSMAIMEDTKVALPAKLPKRLRSVVGRCLEKDPARRYDSADKLAADLRSCEPPPGPAPAPYRLLLAVATVFAALLLIVLLLRGHSSLRNLPTATPVHRTSIAVLTLRNSTGRPDVAWLSTALSEMLTSELAAGPHLRAIAAEKIARLKLDVPVGDSDSLAPDTLHKVRSNLGSDYLILGSFTDLGRESGGNIRLDLRLEDARKGIIVAAFGENGTEAGLFDLVSRAGTRLRQALAAGPLPESQAAAVKAELPSDPEVAKLYADGLAKLWAFDPTGARPLLESAVARDPQFPLAHSALAAALSALGYDSRAREEAKRAYDLSASLGQEQQLIVEGRYRVVSGQWERAQEVYRRLFTLFPDNADYGESLVTAETMNGRSADVVATLSVLRQLPPPANLDPRIDLAQAYWAESVSDYRLEEQAASHAVKLAEAMDSALLAARGRLARATALWKLGQPEPALAALRSAESAFALRGDRDGEAQAASEVAQIKQGQGNLAEARQGFERALEAWQAAGDRRGVAVSLNNLGILHWQQGDAEHAKKLYGQALAAYREIGDESGAAVTLGNAAGLFYNEGQIAKARQMYEESAARYGELGDKSGLAGAFTNIALVLANQGNLPAARSKYEQAAALAREIGTRSQLAQALEGLGDVAREQGALDDAGRWYAQALSIRRELGEKGSVAETSVDLAWRALEQGRPAEARALLIPSLEELRKEGEPDLEAFGEAALAQAFLSQGRQDQAVAASARARTLAQRVQNRAIGLTVATIGARVEAASNEPARLTAARQTLVAVESEASRLGFVDRALEARLALAEIDAQHKDPQAAAHLAEVETQAQQLGFGLIARKARQSAQ